MRFNILFICSVVFLGLKAQNFTSTSYSNSFEGRDYSLNGQDWNELGAWGNNIITYTQNEKMTINYVQNGWIYAENKFNQSIDISSNKILNVNASFSSPEKYLLIQLFDESNRTSGVFSQSIFSLGQESQSFSIDFNSLPTYNIDFTKIKGVRLWIVSDQNASSFAVLNGDELILN